MSSPTDPSPWRLVWSDELSVCIPEIDAEHQRFIGLVNQLNEAIIGRLELEEIKKRMRALLNDAVAHFAHEEKLFGEWEYPQAGDHAIKHAQILQALGQIMHNFKQGSVEYEWIEAGLTIKQILIEHILGEDMKYRDFCCNRGNSISIKAPVV
jgi:hemerythrin-like metal-binding protein